MINNTALHFSRLQQTAAVWGLLLLIGIGFALKPQLKETELVQELKGRKSIDSVVASFGGAARQRLEPKFAEASVDYPPKSIILVGLKTEKVLEVYARDAKGQEQHVCTYPILGTSGVLGPKLKEGDKQMPEGFYRIREFEPNSSYHVALRLDYPSPFDKERGKDDGRSHLGSDIMIHGKDKSVGCLAMGDPAAEDIFVLVHDVGLENTELLISPYDFRKPPSGISLPDSPKWITSVYQDLRRRIRQLSRA